jgi:hypothetical protein
MAAVLALVVLASAASGPWELVERRFDFSLDRPVETTQPPPMEVPEGEAPPPPQVSTIDLEWLAGVAQVVAYALFAVAVAGVLWWLWLRLRQRDVVRSAPLPTGGAADAVTAEPELPVLRRGVAEAQRSLDGIAVASDAVIAAWLALEEAASASGVRRDPAQTPTEFTVAVLERTDADPDAASELLGLYHRARFSHHVIGPVEVDRAARCLGALAARWDALAAAAQAGAR